jgi:hypothetical protein
VVQNGETQMVVDEKLLLSTLLQEHTHRSFQGLLGSKKGRPQLLKAGATEVGALLRN